MVSIQQTGTDGTGAVHTPAKQPSIKAWQEAARAAAPVTHLQGRRYAVQSATHARAEYTVDLDAQTCNCPAHGPCYHIVKAQRREHEMAEAAARQHRAFLKAELLRLKASYGDGLFWLAVEEVELMPS